MQSKHILPLLALATSLATSVAVATPFSISTQLTGDPRLANPDGLIVDVTITGDTTSASANFLVDINSPLHPNVKLDSFFFNLTGAPANYSFSGFTPSLWEVTTPANNAQGSGGADFLFAASDGANGNQQVNVTNSQSLLFTVTVSSGTLSLDNFLLAPTSTSNDATLGSGQLGAHLQSLTATPGASTSGFALGNYEGGGNPNNVPEPETLSLFGIALISLGLSLVRKNRKNFK